MVKCLITIIIVEVGFSGATAGEGPGSRYNLDPWKPAGPESSNTAGKKQGQYVIVNMSMCVYVIVIVM